MNYELAKQLKDAGFPQQLPDPSSYYVVSLQTGDAKVFGWSEGEDKPYRDYVKCPTLEELIEACGVGFLQLIRKSSTGYSACAPRTSVKPQRQGEGSTPSEAVARLWLVLNSK